MLNFEAAGMYATGPLAYAVWNHVGGVLTNYLKLSQCCDDDGLVCLSPKHLDGAYSWVTFPHKGMVEYGVPILL